MRRFMLSLALVASLLVPAAASAATERCTVTIAPEVGSPTDVYRILVSNVPLEPDVSVEVRVDVRLLGSRSGSIYFAFLIPNITEFYIDHNVTWEGEPAPDPLAPGRYQVLVSTPHIKGGCRAVGGFVVEG